MKKAKKQSKAFKANKEPKVVKAIYFFNGIDSESVGKFFSNFQEADNDNNEIYIYMCSQGGWVEGAMAMHDIIKTSFNKVTIIGCGTIASAAILPFSAGDTRLVLPSTNMFFHSIRGSLSETPLPSLKVIQAEINRLNKTYCNIVSRASSVPSSVVEQMMEQETYLDAKQMKALNLIDEVLPWKNKKH